MNPPSDPPPSGGLSYRDSGVDIEAGNRLVDRIKPAARSTFRPEVLTGPGGFGALFELPQGRYRRPVLVSGTDGVGTKLKLAQRLGEHRTIGIDLVAMCANDILVQGAEPLFFLDYFATGRLNVDLAATVIEGIAEGCRQAGAALIGGESAEMPGMYAGEDYDLAGFCVGVVERERILDGSAIKVGDRLVGIASTGPHSNGYSLIRRVLERPGTDPAEPLGDTTVGRTLLTPTRIYVSLLLPLLAEGRVHALAHITGGGITENLPRILGAGQAAEIRIQAWPRPLVFEWIQGQGGVAEDEMLRTFNCGIGMIAVVSPGEVESVISHCRDGAVRVWDIGEITAAGDGQPAVRYI